MQKYFYEGMIFTQQVEWISDKSTNELKLFIWCENKSTEDTKSNQIVNSETILQKQLYSVSFDHGCGVFILGTITENGILNSNSIYTVLNYECEWYDIIFIELYYRSNFVNYYISLVPKFYWQLKLNL